MSEGLIWLCEVCHAMCEHKNTKYKHSFCKDFKEEKDFGSAKDH